MKPIIIYSTFPSKEEAQKVSDLLLEQKLVACTQLHKIESKFHWQGKLDTAEEYLMTCKTLCHKFKEIEQLIKANHSYFVPEIISVKIKHCSKAYQNWLKETVR